MSTLFWTGEISFPLRIMVNMGSLVAWITGNAQNTSAMKQRMKNGYNGVYSDYVHRYDEIGAYHYKKISNKILEKVDCRGKKVIDVGCGTGILSLMTLKKGAAEMVCLDNSDLMLEKCKAKIFSEGYRDDSVTYHLADAEAMPFNDNSFDIVLLNMVLGMIPNQQAMISELARVLRPGGTIALSAHGPAHYREAIEANLKVMTMRYFLDHRFEFWQRDENEVKSFFIKSGLKNIQTERIIWTDEFEEGGQAFDFFAATSALWWYDKLPRGLREKEANKTRNYYKNKKIKSITSDVVLAYGVKN